MAGIEKREHDEQMDLDKTLASIGGSDFLKPEKRWLKIALAGFVNDIPSEKRSKPDANDLRWGMNARIVADIQKDPEVAKNPDVQRIQKEIESRLAGISDPKKLLEAYAQMRGMLAGAIGWEEGSEAKWIKDLRNKQIDQQASNDLASLDFVQLWEKLRQALSTASRERALNSIRRTADARAAGYTETQENQAQAPKILVAKLDETFP